MVSFQQSKLLQVILTYKYALGEEIRQCPAKVIETHKDKGDKDKSKSDKGEGKKTGNGEQGGKINIKRRNQHQRGKIEDKAKDIGKKALPSFEDSKVVLPDTFDTEAHHGKSLSTFRYHRNQKEAKKSRDQIGKIRRYGDDPVLSVLIGINLLL